jgi:DNA-binding transcriptional MerR regulator
MLSIYGNLEVNVMQTQDSIAAQDWRVVVVDHESNVAVSEEVSVPKLVERPVTGTSNKLDNVHTRGDGVLVGTVVASADEVNVQRLDRCARLRRQLLLQKLPAELRQECLAQCLETIAAATQSDGDAARKSLIESFEEIGVTLDDLKAFLGHSMKSVTDDETLQLRNILNAIREGEATWSEYLASKRPTPSKRTREIKQRAADNKAPAPRQRRARTPDAPPDKPQGEQAGSDQSPSPEPPAGDAS